jgi:hypothetical protein
MPFTLSHAAAVIPFRRTPFIMSALVAGCFVPDFAYLLSLSPRMSYGHTFPGMFLLDLPLALIGLWMFHAFLKQPILLFFPVGFRRRFKTSVRTFRFWPVERFSLIVLSTLIGIATHLFWDAFTHQNSWIYENWAFLRTVVLLPTGPMPMFKVLEYASSVFGLVVVAIWVVYWYRTTEPMPVAVAEPVDRLQRRTLVFALPSLAILGGLLRAYHANKGHLSFSIQTLVHFTADTLIAGITFFLLGLLLCGIFFRRHKVVHSHRD